MLLWLIPSRAGKFVQLRRGVGHLKRLMAEYIRYYHEDRTHLGLAKDTQGCRRNGRYSYDKPALVAYLLISGRVAGMIGNFT
jgi:hypothetical protein